MRPWVRMRGPAGALIGTASVTTWIDDLAQAQEEQDDKLLFYNSETLLNKGELLAHFEADNK